MRKREGTNARARDSITPTAFWNAPDARNPFAFACRVSFANTSTDLHVCRSGNDKKKRDEKINKRRYTDDRRGCDEAVVYSVLSYRSLMSLFRYFRTARGTGRDRKPRHVYQKGKRIKSPSLVLSVFVLFLHSPSRSLYLFRPAHSP